MWKVLLVCNHDTDPLRQFCSSCLLSPLLSPLLSLLLSPLLSLLKSGESFRFSPFLQDLSLMLFPSWPFGLFPFILDVDEHHALRSSCSVSLCSSTNWDVGRWEVRFLSGVDSRVLLWFRITKPLLLFFNSVLLVVFIISLDHPLLMN